MHSYNSIAVGTDGSPTSLVAVRAAASLARVYDAQLTVICAHYTASGSMLNSTNAELSKIDIVTETGSQEILARARALDSNMFIVALGQADPEVTGVPVPKKGPTGVGHSLVSDPLGKVLNSLDGAERLEIVEIDLSAADTAAETVPVLTNAKLGY